MKKNIITLICFLFLFQNSWSQLDGGKQEEGVGDPYDLPNLFVGLTVGLGAGDMSYSGSGLLGTYADYSKKELSVFGSLSFHWGSPFIDEDYNVSSNEFKTPLTTVFGVAYIFSDIQRVGAAKISGGQRFSTWVTNANKRKQWLLRGSMHNTSNMFSSVLIDREDAFESLFSRGKVYLDGDDTTYMSHLNIRSICVGFEHRYYVNLDRRRTRDSFSFDFMYSPWINLDDVIIEGVPGHSDGVYSFLNGSFIEKVNTGVKARFSRVSINRKNTFGSDFFIEAGIIPGLKDVYRQGDSARTFLRIGLTMLFMQKV